MLLVTRFSRKWRSSDVWLVETLWVGYSKTAFKWLFYCSKTKVWIDLHRIIQWMVKEDHKRGSTNHVHWKAFCVISNKFKWVIFKDFAKNSPNIYKREMLLVTRFFRIWRSWNVWLVEAVWVEWKNSIQLTVLFFH